MLIYEILTVLSLFAKIESCDGDPLGSFANLHMKAIQKTFNIIDNFIDTMVNISSMRTFDNNERSSDNLNENQPLYSHQNTKSILSFGFRSKLAVSDNDEKKDNWKCAPGLLEIRNLTQYKCSDSLTLSEIAFTSSNRDLCSDCDLNDDNCKRRCCVLNGTITGETCRCPIDRVSGKEDCGEYVPFRCEVNMLSPKINCSRPRDWIKGNLYRDPSLECSLFNPTDTLNMSFSMDCFSLKPYNLTGNQSSFTYFARNGNRFVLSSDPRLHFSARIFNFNNIHDYMEFGSLLLGSSDYYLAKRNISFLLDLSKITSNPNLMKRYLHGGRIYFEAGIFENFPGNRKFIFERRYIHFKPLEQIKSEFYYFPEVGLSKSVIMAVAISLGLLIVSIFGVICYYFKGGSSRSKNFLFLPSGGKEEQKSANSNKRASD